MINANSLKRFIVALNANKPLTEVRISTLLYYAHGWSYALYNVPLVQEAFVAYAYGVHLPSITHFERDTFHAYEEISEDISKLLIRVWRVYNRNTDLIKTEAAVIETVKRAFPFIGTTIPQELIRRDFRAKHERGLQKRHLPGKPGV